VHKVAMAQNIAKVLGIDASQVNVKAKTTEKLGFTGRGEGIAAKAVALLVKA
jgi:2-C-methyl-D-erythritol 2,4-cyclodiphosphate synthase